MVNSCCICGKESDWLSNRSFHRFPKDENMKKKWCDIIGKSINYAARVCSDHFKKCDYKNYESRRLLHTAIPSCKNRKLNCDSNVINKENPLQLLSNAVDSESEPHVDVINENLFCDNNCNEDKENVECITNKQEQYADTNSGTETFLPISTENVDMHVVSHNESLKRKRSPENDAICNKKIYLLLPGKGLEVFKRSDFTSDETWHTFVKCATYNDLHKKLLLQKCVRLSERVSNLRSLLHRLGKKQLLSPAVIDAIKEEELLEVEEL